MNSVETGTNRRVSLFSGREKIAERNSIRVPFEAAKRQIFHELTFLK